MSPKRRSASEYDPNVLELYDRYVHGLIDRREFLQRTAKYAVGGVTAAAILDSLSPNYAWAAQVASSDERISVGYENYDSPEGHGSIRGYLARPAEASGEDSAVLVVHENRGLNPYIEDVARRLAVEGFVAFAPDGLTPLGGYPGNDDDGRAMQRKLDREKLSEDFIAAARWLSRHADTKSAIGVTGFCYGGGIANMLAVRLPEIVSAAAPYYGRQPAASDVSKIKASMLMHYAENDQRVNAGWTDYEAALKQHGVSYEAFIYPAVNHGFHNDTTPRYDEAAAKLSWERTVALFKENLG